MNHRKIGTDSAHRRAILRNMTTSVLMHGKVETTEVKAKEVRRMVDKMITLGKKGDLAAYRQAAISWTKTLLTNSSTKSPHLTRIAMAATPAY